MPKNSKPNQPIKKSVSQDQSKSGFEFDLSSIAESSTESFLLFDENLNCVGINPAGQVLFSMSDVEVVGRNIVDIIPAVKDNSMEREKYISVIKNSELLTTNTKIGELFLGIKAFKVGDGLGVTATKITTGNGSESLVQKDKDYWLRLFNSLNDAVISIDKDRNIVAINDRGVTMLEKDREHILGKKCHQILYNSDKPIDNCPLMSLLQNNEAKPVFFEQFGRYYSLKASVVSDSAGDVTGFSEVIRDITDQKQVEVELEEKCSQLVARLERLSFEEKRSEELRKRCLELEAMVEESEAEHVKVEELKKRYAKLEAKLNKVEAEKQGSGELGARYAELEAMLERMQSEVKIADRLRKRCRDLEDKLEEQAGELKELGTFRQQCADLKTKLKEVESDVKNLGALKEYCTELEIKLDKKIDVDRKSEELQNRCDELESTLEGMEQELKDLSELKERYAQLEAKLVEQLVEIANSEELKRQCAELQMKCVGIEEEILALKQKEKQEKEELENIQVIYGGIRALRTMFDSVDDAVFLIDKNNCIESVNDIGLKLLGKDKEEVIGRDYYQVIGTVDQLEDNDPLRKAAETGIVQLNTVELSGKYCIVRACPVFDKDSELVKMSVVIKDISPIRVFEEKIKDYEDRYNSLSQKMENWNKKLDALQGVN